MTETSGSRHSQPRCLAASPNETHLRQEPTLLGLRIKLGGLILPTGLEKPQRTRGWGFCGNLVDKQNTMMKATEGQQDGDRENPELLDSEGRPV